MSEVANIVVHSFLPDHRKRYVRLNLKQSSLCRAHDRITVPFYPHDRPRYTIIHCLKRKEGEKFPRCNVTCVDSSAGKFHVKGSGEVVYNVSFGSYEECLLAHVQTLLSIIYRVSIFLLFSAP